MLKGAEPASELGWIGGTVRGSISLMGWRGQSSGEQSSSVNSPGFLLVCPRSLRGAEELLCGGVLTRAEAVFQGALPVCVEVVVGSAGGEGVCMGEGAVVGGGTPGLHGGVPGPAGYLTASTDFNCPPLISLPSLRESLNIAKATNCN